jgi:hypothetical protein
MNGLTAGNYSLLRVMIVHDISFLPRRFVWKPWENQVKMRIDWGISENQEIPMKTETTNKRCCRKWQNHHELPKTWDYQPMCRITLLALVDLTRCLRDHRAGMYVKLLTQSLQVWLKTHRNCLRQRHETAYNRVYAWYFAKVAYAILRNPGFCLHHFSESVFTGFLTMLTWMLGGD